VETFQVVKLKSKENGKPFVFGKDAANATAHQEGEKR